MQQIYAKHSRSKNKQKFQLMIKTYKEHWEYLFKINCLNKNLDKPLTQKILSDSGHPITRHLIYMYSMESFIYKHLNRACRDKDKKQIQYYGAYAAALSYILHHANSNRVDKLKG